jgi:hypothetical protein
MLFVRSWSVIDMVAVGNIPVALFLLHVLLGDYPKMETSTLPLVFNIDSVCI